MESKPKLFITRLLPKPVIDKLNAFFDVTVNPEDRILEKKEIIENIRDKEALLCLLTDTIDRDIIEAAANLKVISNYAVGFNNIDIDAATKRKIPVCIMPSILTNATADLTFGLILAVARRIVEADKFTRNHQFKSWGPTLFLGADVYGKTLGIIGMGRIGQAVAKRAEGFDMKVIYTANSDKHLLTATRLSLNEVLQQADFISIHAPLTPETHHLIGKEQFQLMKKTAFIINTARGPIIDEIALVTALKNRTIAGAGLDVFEHEPKITEALFGLDNVILLPHIGSATLETRTKAALLAADNLILVFQGQKPLAMAN